jgi:hypothetical protein
MSQYYILDGHQPVPADLMAWALWFGEADRKVAMTDIDGVKVSTVFLGIDHSFTGGPPELFETLVFGLDDDRCDRYATWDEAVAGHERIVAALVGQALG